MYGQPPKPASGFATAIAVLGGVAAAGGIVAAALAARKVQSKGLGRVPAKKPCRCGGR